MPRPYRLGQRQAASDQTRARIIAAARELLMASDGFAGFSLDAVARQADVARMTVYHQFGSKTGLLEALCDSLASTGGIEQQAAAFQRADPLDALDAYIAVFAHFWQSDRLVTRRLRGLAALDPDFEQVVRTRDEWRRKGLRVLLERLTSQHHDVASASPAFPDTPEAREQAIAILHTLLAFEFFDLLAGPDRSIEEVTPTVQRLVHAVLGLSGT